MAKRGKRRGKGAEDAPMVSDDVRESVVAIALVALGAILFLAFFGLAGTFGESLDRILASLIGIARVVIPLLFFILGASVVVGDRQLASWRNLIALGVFIFAFDGLLNLMFARGVTDPVQISHFGGKLGLVVSSFLANNTGVTGAFIITISLVLASIVVLFNTSLTTLFSPLLRMLGAMKGAREDEAEAEDGETFEERQAAKEKEARDERQEASAEEGDEEMAPYVAPAEQVMTTRQHRKIEIPMDLLDDKSSEAKAGDIDRNKEIIVRTLAQFGIEVEMVDVRVGPTVSQYALRPALGVKLARIVALQNDLALALAAHPIRIEAPIPGKALVGIEVPNQTIGRVCLRELLESKEFAHRKTAFTAPVGKDIAGLTQLVSVDRAPHMLVAGATGSGKSVCLNTIIISLLYQNGPDDLKLIMVDPKRVELGVYSGIPHLLVPPITKVEEAINALKWAVREMERRLDHLAKHHARDIDAYNEKTKERMPRIVIVIDELADLMIQNKRDVEAVIVRIAQMARAAGIHLVLATQRPSVDVITGTIKANIPTRLAFAVASQVDSKTILDISGAEKLLGRGDMLMSTPELSKPRRLQGAYLSDKEISQVVNFLKSESPPDYNYQITEGASAPGLALGGDDSDPLLEEAVQIVLDSGKASTSFLQRRMKIGYSRAARIIDLMEQMGVVSAGDGAKPREVLVSEWPPAGSARPNVVLDDRGNDEDEENEVFEDDEEVEEEDDAVPEDIETDTSPDNDLTRPPSR